MKKYISLVYIATIAVITILCFAKIRLEQEKDADFMQDHTDGTFDLSSEKYYLSAIEDFPSQKKVGKILSAEDAKSKAESEWIALFGEKVKSKKPYQVLYDSNQDIWLVKGSLPQSEYACGGIPYILFSGFDGKILAVWHDQ